jgi:hypothetical protein
MGGETGWRRQYEDSGTRSLRVGMATRSGPYASDAPGPSLTRRVSTPHQANLRLCGLLSFGFENEVDVSARGVTVGANLLVRFFSQRFCPRGG